MASNEPVGDNRRIGAVKKRTQRKGKLMGKMDVKKSAEKFKGVRREDRAA